MILKTELKLLLSKGKTKKVIETLLSLSQVVNDNDDLFDEVILISSRYESCSTEKQAGALTFEQVQLQINNINNSLLQVIKSLPNETEKVSVNKPIKKEGKVVELLIDQDFYGFDSLKKENLVGVISGLLNIQRQEVIIRRVSSGSVKVLVEMSQGKALELKKIFEAGINASLFNDELKIKNVTLKNYIFGYKVYINLSLFVCICIICGTSLVLSGILYIRNVQSEIEVLLLKSTNKRLEEINDLEKEFNKRLEEENKILENRNRSLEERNRK